MAPAGKHDVHVPEVFTQRRQGHLMWLMFSEVYGLFLPIVRRTVDVGLFSSFVENMRVAEAHMLKVFAARASWRRRGAVGHHLASTMYITVLLFL